MANKKINETTYNELKEHGFNFKATNCFNLNFDEKKNTKIKS